MRGPPACSGVTDETPNAFIVGIGFVIGRLSMKQLSNVDLTTYQQSNYAQENLRTASGANTVEVNRLLMILPSTTITNTENSLNYMPPTA